MKITNLILFALVATLAVGCASPGSNDPRYGSAPNSDDAALMNDIKNGHDYNTSARTSTTSGAPGSANGPGSTPQ